MAHEGLAHCIVYRRLSQALAEWLHLPYLRPSYPTMYRKAKQPIVRSLLSIGFIYLLASNIALAQLDNRPFEERYSAPTKRFGIGAHSFSYFRNLEWFNPVADGKTLFGQQLSLRGIYKVDSNLSLSAGAFAGLSFGNKGLERIAPLFTLRYQKRNFRLLFGSLEGNLSHRLYEPLQDFESVINQRLEYGTQFQWWHKKLWADVWIDWQAEARRFQPKQERISGGASSTYTLAEGSNYQIEAKGQARVLHIGGQLDTAANKPPLITTYATALGLRGSYSPAENLSLFADIAYMHRGTSTRDSTFAAGTKSGNGIYANAGAILAKRFTLMASYWNGSSFYFPNGGAIYSSISSSVNFDGQLNSRNREIVILRAIANIKLADQATLTINVEPIYDLIRRKGDYGYSFYLNVFIPQF